MSDRNLLSKSFWLGLCLDVMLFLFRGFYHVQLLLNL